MSNSPIRLRDTPTQVQEKLGLSDRHFDNFKDLARRVHNEYCAAHPRSSWADVNVSWTALPEAERLTVIRQMYNLCLQARLFPPTTQRSVIEAGIEQRLHQPLWQDDLPEVGITGTCIVCHRTLASAGKSLMIAPMALSVDTIGKLCDANVDQGVNASYSKHKLKNDAVLNICWTWRPHHCFGPDQTPSSDL
ncbi:hypothetical protein A1O3_01552 [Capronia epimyces CBS 606.96]|uniref:Uncharacterized protein n=1 Tax=Capronia epimyces CBS 606.96 TaxID=1182542 RepID=W9YUR6_9EURO|nr:uncharacterized protein A1O3_01552 [Capronia epimyces CBS 606.96]EXJ92996.1 hypothetical protein A1O3_01552 [Capronia epimyces CBS 606.96]